MRLLFFAAVSLFLLTGCIPKNERVAEPTSTPEGLMRASDPQTFVRAAGKVQFVEFFAFW